MDNTGEPSEIIILAIIFYDISRSSSPTLYHRKKDKVCFNIEKHKTRLVLLFLFLFIGNKIHMFVSPVYL